MTNNIDTEDAWTDTPPSIEIDGKMVDLKPFSERISASVSTALKRIECQSKFFDQALRCALSDNCDDASSDCCFNMRHRSS
jgi:hypothetical protein